MNCKQHWEAVYESKRDAEVSWTQEDLRTSLTLISEVCREGSVIDVGGGTSVLADRLLDAGYSVAVLDISDAALRRAGDRLGVRAEQVRWITADVTASLELGTFDVWHDRAVFHFLTDPTHRAAYVSLLARTVPVGGHAVVATFALDGPEKCSGLPVERYNAKIQADEFGRAFALLHATQETHLTPWGKPQQFTYEVFDRVAAHI